VRAIVPLEKDTEVLFSYRPSLRDRAGRRQSLEEQYGFVCSCELCALPDDHSNAFDAKIKLAKNASNQLERLFEDLRSRVKEDMIRAAQFLEIYLSITIRERLFVDYRLLVLPLTFFLDIGRPTLLQRVGNAVLGVFQRHLGTGVKNNTGVQSVSMFIKSALLDCSSAATTDPLLEARLEKAASSIISALQSLP
jgi:hypothetical protein